MPLALVGFLLPKVFEVPEELNAAVGINLPDRLGVSREGLNLGLPLEVVGAAEVPEFVEVLEPFEPAVQFSYRWACGRPPPVRSPSMTMREIRVALGVAPGDQENLNRRTRELYREFKIARTRQGRTTYYELIARLAVPKTASSISKSLILTPAQPFS